MPAAQQTSRPFPLERTRNIGIAAHIDAGKTTLTERILFYSGSIHRVGEVHDGATITDHMEQERERGITITSAAVTCSWRQSADETAQSLFGGLENRINIIDTPGHVDFTAEVERSLRVLDGAVVVFCGVAGVQPQSETVWRQASKYGVPRIVFVNKMDRVGADFSNVVAEISAKLGAVPAPVLIPIGSEEALSGQIDVLNQRALIYSDDDQSGSSFSVDELTGEQKILAEKALSSLTELLVDSDEILGEMFLDEKEITTKDLKEGLRRATIANKVIPVAGGSAFKNKGIQALLDAIVEYLPSPAEVPAAAGKRRTDPDSTVLVEASDQGEFCALAFKLWADKFVGKLTFFRVYSGVISKGDVVFNSRTAKKERIGRLIQVQADKHQDIESCFSGDIAAIVGLKNVTTGDTLCHPSFDVMLEPPSFPVPVISMAVEPKSQADSDKLVEGLNRLTEEDPTFSVEEDPETGQTIIGGMGELHLEVIIDRLRREFSVQANVGKPQIAYRETISKPASGEGKLIRQAAGKSQYGHVTLELAPAQRGAGLSVKSKVTGGAIPKEFMEAVFEGVNDSLTNGIIAGFPVVDLEVSVTGGSFHEVDSTDNAFKIAAIFAMKDAFLKADPKLLEPIMNVEVSTPIDYQGDLMGDLNRRRGQIQDIETKGPVASVRCHVPLVEMFGYSTDIRTISSGRASYSMEPNTFEEVPPAQVTELVQSRGGIPLEQQKLQTQSTT